MQSRRLHRHLEGPEIPCAPQVGIVLPKVPGVRYVDRFRARGHGIDQRTSHLEPWEARYLPGERMVFPDLRDADAIAWTACRITLWSHVLFVSRMGERRRSWQSRGWLHRVLAGY